MSLAHRFVGFSAIRSRLASDQVNGESTLFLAERNTSKAPERSPGLRRRLRASLTSFAPVAAASPRARGTESPDACRVREGPTARPLSVPTGCVFEPVVSGDLYSLLAEGGTIQGVFSASAPVRVSVVARGARSLGAVRVSPTRQHQVQFRLRPGELSRSSLGATCAPAPLRGAGARRPLTWTRLATGRTEN